MRRAAWIAIACALGSAACGPETPHPPRGWIVAAVADAGAIAILDAESGALVRTVPLAADAMPVKTHNVQGDSAGAVAWTTVMPAMPAGSMGMDMPDELVGVEVATGRIVRRIELGNGLMAAHVVIDGSRAFVTATDADAVLFVDLAGGTVSRRVDLPRYTGPHGARLTPDGKHLVVAGMVSGSMHLVDTETGAVESFDLPGTAVQAAVTPDGAAAFVTLYDRSQVARLDLATKSLSYFDLPGDSAGPLQLYPSPDSRSLWIADQGVDDRRPPGHRLLRVEAKTGRVELVVEVGRAPHGIVVSPDGERVYATMLLDGSVVAVDARSGARLFETAVGARPNGITYLGGGRAMP